MPLRRRRNAYSPVIDCEYKPCFNDAVCCGAPKPFKDKYCEEQKIWREINCYKPKKNICCPTWDKTEEMCSRFRNTTNWNCVKDRNFRENNKTMEALTTCGPRTCLTRARDCGGPYYSMQGPVCRPPGLICQDYSLYIPTNRILEHCQCRGNHRCKKLKRLPGRCYPCTRCCIPIGDECCNSMSCNPCCGQMPCNNAGMAADIHNYCCQKAENQQSQQCCEDSANFPSYDPGTEQDQDNNNANGNATILCPDDICGAVPCNRFSGMTEMQKLLEEFKCKWNHSDPKTGRRINRNPILGINTEPQVQIQLPQKENNNDYCSAAGNQMGNTVCTQQADCDCAACKGREIRLNGNHYDNCTCGICQRRRGCGGFVAAKITDRKADRCKKLWFENQRDPCHVNPDNSDRTVQNITDMNYEVTSTIECTNSVDCPCPACCKMRQYARIKPYNCYANGLTNPTIELKKMYFAGDENNNASGDKQKGKRSKGKGSKPGSGSQSVSSPSGGTTQSNSVTNYGNVTPTSDRSNNNIARKKASQQQLHQKKINVDEKHINYEDEDCANVEYFTGDCQRENPCRKSFGLDVTYRQQCNNDCCNDCSWGCCPNDCCNICCNDCCNNCYYPSCPCDPCQNQECPCGPCPNQQCPCGPCPNQQCPCGPCPNQQCPCGPCPNQQCPCGPCPNQQCPCDPCETSMSNYPHICPPARRLRRRQRCIPAATVMDNYCANGGECNGDCDTNDYNTTVYRESFKRIRPHDDDGWCNGKARYRRGRTFDPGCQNYLLRSNTFGIFDNMFKPIGTPACKQCDEECLQRICHDKQCRVPYSMELRKIRWPIEDDGAPTCCCQCGMLDRYCNTCDQTI